MYYGEVLADYSLTEIGMGRESGDYTYNGNLLYYGIWVGYGEGDGGGNVDGDCICNNETDNL
jgi:hypothetical protein